MGSICTMAWPAARRRLITLVACITLIVSLLPLGAPTTALAAGKLTAKDLAGVWETSITGGRNLLAFDTGGSILVAKKTSKIEIGMGTYTLKGEASLVIKWSAEKQEPITVKIVADTMTITSHSPPSVYKRVKATPALSSSLWTEDFKGETRVWGFGQDGSLGVLGGNKTINASYKADKAGDLQLTWGDKTTSTWHSVPLGPYDLVLWDAKGWNVLKRSSQLVGVWTDKADPERTLIFDALGYMLSPNGDGKTALAYSYNSQKGIVTVGTGSNKGEWKVKLGGGQLTITDRSGVSYWTRNQKALVLSAQPPATAAGDDSGLGAILAGLLGVVLIGGAVVMMAGAAANSDHTIPTMVPFPTPIPMPTVRPFTEPSNVRPSGCECDSYGHAILSCQGIAGCEAYCAGH